jgi:hypothetical protein
MAAMRRTKMDWPSISRIKKFTPLNDLFREYGNPLFKLGNGAAYYVGNGLLLTYSHIRFKVENSCRIEYGEEGEYALSVCYFVNKKNIEVYLKLLDSEFNFDNEVFNNSFNIIDEISVSSTFAEVSNKLREKAGSAYYQEGEKRALKSGKFVFQNNFIIWGNYTFFFFGKSKKTKMGGFEYTFEEG